MSVLQDRFCPEITYGEKGDANENSCGYIMFDMNLPNNRTINVLADAIFNTYPECRWFLITTSYIGCGYDESYWPRIVVKEIEVGDKNRDRRIMKYNYRAQSEEDMERMIDEYNRAVIGITREQSQVGVSALTEYRARKYIEWKRAKAGELYTQLMQEISFINQYSFTLNAIDGQHTERLIKRKTTTAQASYDQIIKDISDIEQSLANL